MNAVPSDDQDAGLVADRLKLAAVFGHEGVAEVYQHRPPYPAEVFDLLTALISASPSTVLDLGAGDGSLARPLAGRVDQVDALDISPAMIEAGKRRPGGDRPNLRWITGSAETAPLGGPYALVTAGESLHWMDPVPTLTRIARVMTGDASLAIATRGYPELAWQAGLLEVIRRHSRSASYKPDFNLPEELANLGLYEVVGTATTAPVPVTRSIAHYIDGLHSTSSLAREHMSEPEIAEFAAAIAALTEPYATDGLLSLTVVGTVVWGRVTA